MLGQPDVRRESALDHLRQELHGVVAREDLLQLHPDPLPGDHVEPGRVLGHRGDRVGLVPLRIGGEAAEEPEVA